MYGRGDTNVSYPIRFSAVYSFSHIEKGISTQRITDNDRIMSFTTTNFKPKQEDGVQSYITIIGKGWFQWFYVALNTPNDNYFPISFMNNCFYMNLCVIYDNQQYGYDQITEYDSSSYTLYLTGIKRLGIAIGY